MAPPSMVMVHGVPLRLERHISEVNEANVMSPSKLKFLFNVICSGTWNQTRCPESVEFHVVGLATLS